MANQFLWKPKCNLNYSFILSFIEFMFGMEVSWDNRHQPHTLLLWELSCHSNQSETSVTPYRILIEFIFGNKTKSFLANMNSIQVNKQDLLRLHSVCHGDYIDVATK